MVYKHGHPHLGVASPTPVFSDPFSQHYGFIAEARDNLVLLLCVS